MKKRICMLMSAVLMLCVIQSPAFAVEDELALPSREKIISEVADELGMKVTILPPNANDKSAEMTKTQYREHIRGLLLESKAISEESLQKQAQMDAKREAEIESTVSVPEGINRATYTKRDVIYYGCDFKLDATLGSDGYGNTIWASTELLYSIYIPGWTGLDRYFVCEEPVYYPSTTDGARTAYGTLKGHFFYWGDGIIVSGINAYVEFYAPNYA